MAGKKIGELTPLGRNLIATDELELSLAGSAGSRKITGAEIIGAAGGVSSVTGTSPIVSSGGSTPAISINVANASQNGYLSSTDWSTFNGKQVTLVSGTNIKTVNSTSLLGSGDVSVGVTSVTGTAPISSTGGATPAISIATATTSTTGALTSSDWNTFNGKQDALVSGTNIKTINGSDILGSGDLSTGLIGAHQITPLSSNETTSASLNANGLVPTFTTTNNRLVTYPFIPNVTFTSQFMYIYVNTAVASSICRILIYSNLNGRPSSKLYESANLDCSTSGQKTALNSFTFTAGTTYWLTCQSQGTPTLFGIPTTNLLPLKVDTLAIATSIRGTAAIGSAPATFSVSAFESANVPFIGINKV